MADEIKNIFVSHQHEDAEKIESLKDLIGRQGIDMRDSSIYEDKSPNHAHNEQYIKREIIKPQIQWAGTVIVLIGEDTAESDYVSWEITTAAEMGKNIFGVFLPGSQNENIPAELLEYGDNLVTWNGDKIARAINGESMNWENADGTIRQNDPTNLPREVC